MARSAYAHCRIGECSISSQHCANIDVKMVPNAAMSGARQT